MEEEVPGKSVKLSSSVGAGEVDYKTKAGTAWSHSYLNQKPWHPLSYPNQRRKWIAEQVNANRARRQEEVAREFAQEQEFFRQSALFNQKEKDKMEMMKAVSFMYVRPPGYNAESAKAAEIADENKTNESSEDPAAASSSQVASGVDKERKARPKDVFGRTLPTEREFEVLKNAPKLDTGVATRSKPFGIEIRNVKCARCGAFGHQSGDRECPMKDVIMPNDESRLKRDDPLNAIQAQTDMSEPLKWELKQIPGMSPPRGGFRPDDPNQQIVADHEEIFDEYGGFLTGGEIPALLSNFPLDKPKKKKKKHHGSKSKSTKRASSSEPEPDKSKRSKSKHKKHYSSDSDKVEKRRRRSKGKHKSNNLSDSSTSSLEDDRHHQLGLDDCRHYSSRKNKKRESKNLDKDTDKSKNTETRSKKPKDEKHATAYSDASEPEFDSQRGCHRHHHHHHRHHSPSSSEDNGYRETDRYDGTHYSSKRSKKRESENLDKDIDRSKSTETRTKKLEVGKHVTARSDTSDSDSDSQRRRHHHRRHHSPSLSEDDGYRDAGRYDGRHYSSKRSKKRGSEQDTDEGKYNNSRSNLIKDEKHVSAYSDTPEFDSDCRRPHHRHYKCRKHRVE